MEEENTNYTPPVSPIENPKVNKPKKVLSLREIWRRQTTFIGIAIIVIVALLLFGGVLAYQYFSIKIQPIVQVQEQNGEMAGWKTYTNTEYGFEFKYPESLTASPFFDKDTNKLYVSLKKDSVPVFSFNVINDNFNQYISNIEQSSGWDEGYNFCENAKSVIDKTENIIFAGSNAKKITLNKCVTLRGPVNYPEDKNFVHIFIPNGSHSYVVILTPAVYMYNYDKISDSLLSTFKFITPTTQTAGWKTYTNTQYGFSIKYPPYFSIRESGRPDAGTMFDNNDRSTNINWVSVSLNLDKNGNIPFDDVGFEQLQNQQTKYKLFQGWQKGGDIRLWNSSVGDITSETYESIGWPSSVPSVSTIIKDGESTIILDVYGAETIDIEKIKNDDFSDFTDLENINNQMLSTFKFTN